MRRAATFLIGASFVAPVAIGAQTVQRDLAGAHDIEAEAEAWGVTLPDGYFTSLRENPNLFAFPTSGWARAAFDVTGTVEPLTGELPVLVVPALFLDSVDPFVSHTDLQAALFDGPSADGTITDFYDEISRGRLQVTGRVAPWVRTSVRLADAVGNSNGLGSDARLGDYLLEAITQVDQTTDLRPFDNDGPDGIPNSGDDDGVVDAVAFEFLERSAPCGGTAVWPHRSSIRGKTGSSYVSNDIGFDGTPLEVNGYIIQGATTCDGLTVQSSNTLAHELGHVLGLPDIYHRVAPGGAAGRRWVIGCWGLMAAGSWGCGFPGAAVPGYGPIHMSPWSKAELGWIDYIEVGDVLEQEYLLDPVQTSGQALRIRLLPGVDEYLVIEYRPQIGFDADLPAEGILAYRENPNGDLRPDANEFYRVHLLEADGRDDLMHHLDEGGNRGEASDAFASNGTVGRLSNLTAPNLLLTDGRPSTVLVHEMAIEDGRARIRLTTRPTPTVTNVPEAPFGAALQPFEMRYDVVGGRAPYSFVVREGALPKGLRAEPSDREMVLGGRLLESGSFRAVFDVVDAGGVAAGAALVLEFEIDEIVVEDARVVNALFGETVDGLSEGERAFIDVHGNDDGSLDIGDLRAALRRNR